MGSLTEVVAGHQNRIDLYVEENAADAWGAEYVPPCNPPEIR
jgi:hypothetical protein